MIGLGLSGAFIILFLHILNHSTNGTIPFVVFATAGITLCLLIADGVVTLYVGLAQCQPRVSDETRQDWEDQFGLPGSRLAWYADGILVLVVGIGAAFLLVHLGQVSTGIKVLSAAHHVLLACLLPVTLLLLLIGMRRDSVRTTVSVVSQAFSAFWQYDGHEHAAGIYRPEGLWRHCHVRRLSVLLAVTLLSAAILPAAAYFPLTLSSPEPWKTVAAETDESLLTLFLDIFQIGTPLHEYRSSRRQDLAGCLDSAPEAWMWIALEGISRGRAFFVWTVFCSAVCCCLLPPLIAACTVLTVSGPIVVAIGEEVLDEDNIEFETTWDGLVDQIQTSPDAIEKDSLFVGMHSAGGYPVLAHRSMLREHGHILGDTGSGKTAIGIAPMVTQLIRMAGRDNLTRNAEQSSVVILDLKGDPALFHGARIEAEEAGLPFRWFTNQTGLATYVFNPFQQSHVQDLTTIQWAQTLTEALSLAYGDGYGPGFFSAENQDVLATLLDAFDVSSFRQLSDVVHEGKQDLLGKKLRFDRKKQEDARALFTVLKSLAPIEALNALPENGRSDQLFEHQIDLPSVLESPQVVYFYLRAGIEVSTVQRIGKLALHCLLSASANRITSGPRKHQTYLFIDEFQQLVSQSVELVLRQARSMNIATILAHQTISDLMINDTDVTPTVQGNTRFKQFFAAGDLNQQKTLIESSGETIDHVLSWGHGNTHGEHFSESFNESMTESIQPRMTRNDVIRMTDDPTSSVLQLPRGDGYARFEGFPFIVEGMYHITEAEYAERTAAPWPCEDDWPGTLTPQAKPRRSEKIRPAPVPPATPAAAETDASAQQPAEDGIHGFEDVLDELEQNAQHRRRKGRPQSEAG